jgi:HB1, ASXL, restriction endonuclease HTH domain
MPSDMTWKQAIEKVLSESSYPMHYTEITEKILSGKILSTSGATPAATVNAQITTSIKSNPQTSPFIALGRGVYFLRSKVIQAPVAVAGKKKMPPARAVNQSSEAIRAFGMFWRREMVDWKNKPNIWGMQGLTAKPVDLSGQCGIYLLYDGREVIYVGRTDDQGLGQRLFQQHVGRLATRWDRFSWFGFLPVNQDGSLGKMESTVSSESLISAFEAVLIEAVEPRQNRKRGDDFGALEFIQAADEFFEKKKARKMAISALVGD